MERMDFWNLYGSGARLGAVMKYAIFGSVLVAILFGTYYLGYRSGANNTRVEYVTKEIEVIKYVDKKKSDIYSRPNASKEQLLDLMKNNML